MTPGAPSDEAQYNLSQPDDGLTDRLAPMWWKETRTQELQDYFAEHLATLSCPLQMEIRPEDSPGDQVLYVWQVRREGDVFELGMPGGKGHISIRDRAGDELSALLAKWADEDTPLIVEITHGP